MKILSGKKMAMIIAPIDFRDEEYFIPKSVFKENGAEVITASLKKGEALGSYGGVAKIDELVDDLKTDKLDVLIFVGGSGAVSYLENKQCHKLANEMNKQGKIVGAICIAPIILARAGVLVGRKATVWSSPMDKSAVKILEKAKVDYLAQPVVVDGNIITANGASQARRFAERISQMLTLK